MPPLAVGIKSPALIFRTEVDPNRTEDEQSGKSEQQSTTRAFGGSLLRSERGSVEIAPAVFTDDGSVLDFFRTEWASLHRSLSVLLAMASESACS